MLALPAASARAGWTRVDLPGAAVGVTIAAAGAPGAFYLDGLVCSTAPAAGRPPTSRTRTGSPSTRPTRRTSGTSRRSVPRSRAGTPAAATGRRRRASAARSAPSGGRSGRSGAPVSVPKLPRDRARGSLGPVPERRRRAHLDRGPRPGSARAVPSLVGGPSDLVALSAVREPVRLVRSNDGGATWSGVVTNLSSRAAQLRRGEPARARVARRPRRPRALAQHRRRRTLPRTRDGPGSEGGTGSPHTRAWCWPTTAGPGEHRRRPHLPRGGRPLAAGRGAGRRCRRHGRAARPVRRRHQRRRRRDLDVAAVLGRRVRAAAGCSPTTPGTPTPRPPAASWRSTSRAAPGRWAFLSSRSTTSPGGASSTRRSDPRAPHVRHAG